MVRIRKTANDLIPHEKLLLKAAKVSRTGQNNYEALRAKLTEPELNQLDKLGYITHGFYIDEVKEKVVDTYALTEDFDRWEGLLKKSRRTGFPFSKLVKAVNISKLNRGVNVPELAGGVNGGHSEGVRG